MDPSVGLRGTTTPYLAHRFGSGHIPPSTPFTRGFSLPSFGLNTSVHSYGGDSRYMNVEATAYIPYYVPLSIVLIPSNVVLLSNLPYIPHSPSGSGSPFNYVFPSLAGAVVSVGYAPPHVSGG